MFANAFFQSSEMRDSFWEHLKFRFRQLSEYLKNCFENVEPIRSTQAVKNCWGKFWRGARSIEAVGTAVFVGSFFHFANPLQIVLWEGKEAK